MASRGVNKVILVGRVGQIPEVRYSQQGTAFATLSIATSEQWNDKQTGEKKEITEWHRVVLNGKTAEIAGEYLRKGSEVYFEGKLRTRKWKDKNGIDKYTTEIIVGSVGEMQMLGGKQETRQENTQTINQYKKIQHSSSSSTANSEPPLDFDDDIPF